MLLKLEYENVISIRLLLKKTSILLIIYYIFEFLKSIHNTELLKNNKVDFPIKLSIIGKFVAVVDDERIPDNWYNDDFCTVCCPENLLPLPQRLKIKREETSGKRIKKKFNN